MKPSRTLRLSTRRVALLATLVGLLPPLPVLGQQSVADHPRVVEAVHLLDAWIDAEQAYRGIPGASLAVIHDQEQVLAKGYGFAHVETGVPARSDTQYSICSISKLFTSVGVMQLRDAGRLRLSDPVAQHLEWFDIRETHPEAGPVTVEGILTHSSGLPRESGYPYWTGPDYPFPTRDQVVSRVSEQETLYPARTYYQYSNLGLTLAGEIVAALSGHSYDEYIHGQLIEPLGMANTFTEFRDEDRGGRLATGYSGVGRDGKRTVIPDYSIRGIAPAAGFVSTVEDLGRFASWQFRALAGKDDGILDRNTLREMHRVHWMEPDGGATYGLGFSVSQSGGKTFVGHGGSCPGYRSQLVLRPQDAIATTFMTNGHDVNAGSYARRAYEIVAPAILAAVEDPDAVAKPDQRLARLTGTYDRPLGGESLVLEWQGQLAVVGFPTADPLTSLIKLRHVEGDTFRRVRDNGDLGEAFTFEELPDGSMRMWRNDNYSVRPAMPAGRPRD